MNLQEASELVTFKTERSFSQRWLDLGSGTGLFTLALARQLPDSSIIVAVDKTEMDLKQIPKTFNRVAIETRLADFIKDDLRQRDIDGILMANSFHYVADKNSLLHKLIPLMKKDSSFLVVEYDMDSANKWVPYPLSMDAAKELFAKRGFTNFQLLGIRLSAYGRRHMYAALIS